MHIDAYNWQHYTFSCHPVYDVISYIVDEIKVFFWPFHVGRELHLLYLLVSATIIAGMGVGHPVDALL